MEIVLSLPLGTVLTRLFLVARPWASVYSSVYNRGSGRPALKGWLPSPGLCQAYSANTAIILRQVVGPPPEMTQPPPVGAVGASLGGRGCFADSALSWRRNCRDRSGRSSPRRSPKESGFSLAEPLRGSAHCPGPRRRFPGLAGQEHGRQQQRPQPLVGSGPPAGPRWAGRAGATGGA